MRFLVDNNLSPRLDSLLNGAGHDAVHLREIADPSCSNESVFELAAASDRVILAQDTDFGTILAGRAVLRPSVVLVRRNAKSTESVFEVVLTGNLSTIQADLDAGAIVVFDDARIRVRRLPLG